MYICIREKHQWYYSCAFLLFLAMDCSQVQRRSLKVVSFMYICISRYQQFSHLFQSLSTCKMKGCVPILIRDADHFMKVFRSQKFLEILKKCWYSLHSVFISFWWLISAWNEYSTSARHCVRQSAVRASHSQFVPVTICYDNFKRM